MLPAGRRGGVEIGAALLGLLNAELRAGVRLSWKRATASRRLRNIRHLVITGEGRLDSQSICGKTPIGVAKLKRYHKPVIALAGGLQHDHTLCISRVSCGAVDFVAYRYAAGSYTRRNNLSLSARAMAAVIAASGAAA